MYRCCYFTYQILLFSFFSILSGDVELNNGPVNGRNWQCRVLYSSIRGAVWKFT